MKGYFGFFYYERLAFIYFIFLLLPLFFKDKISLPAYLIVLIFIFFNFLKLYPLGGGRTDLILFPTVLFLISRSIYSIKFGKKYLISIFIILLIAVPSVTEPYYKIENISPILKDISPFINNENAYIIPMYEQQNSFEFYSAELYGQFLTTTKNGCAYLKPNISNYSIFLPESQERWDKILSVINETDAKEIYLIGIELDGTNGMIRDAEKYLLGSGMTKVSEKVYDVGMLLIKYSN